MSKTNTNEDIKKEFYKNCSFIDGKFTYEQSDGRMGIDLERVFSWIESKLHQKELSVIEKVDNYKHLIYWLADCYQVNFEEFRPEPNMPKWKHEAFMNFSTVQGFSLRQKVKTLSEQKTEKEKISKALEDILTQLKPNKEVKE